MYPELKTETILQFDEDIIKDDFTFNKVRVKQVFAAITENGLEPFDDYGLAKLLSMLTPREFEVLKINLSNVLGLRAQIKLENIEPLYRYYVEKEIKHIKRKDIYKYYLESLSSKKYLEFFKSLSVEELADIRKVVVFNLDINSKINRTASKKLFDFITFEIKTRNIKKIAEA